MHALLTRRRRRSYDYKVEAGERRIDPVEFIAWGRACGLVPSEVLAELE